MAQVNKETLAFEIGVEEIPAFDLKGAVEQLKKMVPAAMSNLNIPFGDTEIYSSPRRLIVLVHDVARETEAKDEEFRGPAVKIAFDAQGAPTKAAQGFARGRGIDVSELTRKFEGDTEYVYATCHTDAKNTVDLLPDALLSLITGLSWPRSCRWASRRELFVRPVRWIVAMLGNSVIPLEFAGVHASNKTMGHRVLAPGFHEVKDADALLDVVRAAYVIPSQKEREEIIRSGVSRAEAKTGLTSELNPKTLTEVINLSEYPSVLVAEFDQLFLQVPEEIIVDSMLTNQRYFPLYDANHKLSNKFIVVSNGNPEYAENIINGNQRVVDARLYDAKFFYDEDLKKPLGDFVPKLKTVVFQEDLGTVYDKTQRIVKIADALAAQLTAAGAMSAAVAKDISEAAYLCKADLVSGAVIEFTSVQGIMGAYYAKACGKNDNVAGAIADHYKPRFSGDALPQTHTGCVVAMADKLDTICGLFAVGQAPTGSSDPFALRRAAIGIVNILAEIPQVSLVSAVDFALTQLAGTLDATFDAAAVREEILNFFITRTKVIAKEEGIPADIIDAVLAVRVQEPIEMLNRVRALLAARNENPELFEDLATAYARAHNLADAAAGCDYDEAALSSVQAALARAVVACEAAVGEALEANNYAAALQALSQLRAPIDEFFECVLIVDENESVRKTNMQLLNRFTNVFANIADIGLIAAQ